MSQPAPGPGPRPAGAGDPPPPAGTPAPPANADADSPRPPADAAPAGAPAPRPAGDPPPPAPAGAGHPGPPYTTDLPVPAVALAIGAHPDDVEFGAGATLAKWAAAGCRIHHLVLTDGSKGSWDPEADTAALVALRRDEQREASRRLGGQGAVTFLAWPDGELTAGVRQRFEVAACIRRLRPDVVLGHDPWKRYRLHPDHRNAGYLLTEGVVAARDPHFFPELADPPHRPSAILLWEADEINHFEHVEPPHVDAKIQALLAHRSQLRSTMGVEDPDDEPAREAYAARVRTRAHDTGALGDGRPAEAFHLMTESLMI